MTGRLSFVLALLAVCACRQTPLAPAPVTSVAELVSLSSAKLAEGRPVRFRATVTTFDRRWAILVVEQNGRGVSVQYRRTLPSLERGDVVDVSGFTAYDNFVPLVVRPMVTRVRAGTVPKAPRADVAQMLKGKLDYRWVELACVPSSGRIIDALHWEVDVNASGRTIKVLGGLFQKPNLDYLYHRSVLIRGVPVTSYSPTGEPLNVRFYAVGAPDVTVPGGVPPHADPEMASADVEPVPADTPPLTHLAQIKTMLNAESERRYPVKLRAVVTMWNPRNRDLFIQEGDAGIYTSRRAGVETPPVKVGDIVDVEGVTRRSGYGPRLEIARIAVVGHGPLPKPHIVHPSEGFAGKDENAWVEVEGVVHAVQPETPAGALLAFVSGTRRVVAFFGEQPAPERLQSLVGHTVRVHGVWGPLFSSDETLIGVIANVPSLDFIDVLDVPVGDGFDSLPRRVRSLREYVPGEVPRHLVKLRGRVVYASDEGFAYLADESGGMRIDGARLNAGDSVEVLGFPSVGRVRGALEVYKTRPSPVAVAEPAPRHVAVEAVNFGVYDGQIVTLDAFLTRRVVSMGDQDLTLHAGHQEITARLEYSRPVPGWEELREGALVRLTGVCQIEWDDSTVPPLPLATRILLRSPADVTIMRSPPWWTPSRLRWILGITLLAVVVILAWVIALRRRVRAQVHEHAALWAQLLQAQKLESVGRLAGGVAHDFNNLLTVISGYTHVLRMKLADQEDALAFVDEIGSAGERAAALTQQLLAFSRNQRLQPVVFDLNALVVDMEKMLSRLIGADIALRHSIDDEPCLVLADSGQMGQVLMNLAVNARDAMPHGGELVLATRHIDLDARTASLHGDLSAGRYVELEVRDSGVGMDAETRARIFEPFFTTKGRGQGTGLGLATVFGIVKQSGGHIWVESSPGRGSSFRIYLPATQGAPTRASASSSGSGGVRGAETVLLVEDQDEVRRIVRGSLVELGYRVHDAATPAAALEWLESNPERIHLLITDMIMPGMNGQELSREIVSRRPDVRVLYMSGYTDCAVDGADFLQKPFAPETLAKRVREILDRKA